MMEAVGLVTFWLNQTSGDGGEDAWGTGGGPPADTTATTMYPSSRSTSPTFCCEREPEIEEALRPCNVYSRIPSPIYLI